MKTISFKEKSYPSIIKSVVNLKSKFQDKVISFKMNERIKFNGNLYNGSITVK
jgi:hypothetical protein